MKTKRELSAPCGIDCFNCEVFEKNLTEQVRGIMAERLGLRPEEVACRGCREQQGCRLHWKSCDTLDCVLSKGVEFCFQCGEFPCTLLQPAADGAGTYPHNMKVFNLCRMKRVGVEKWAEEEAAVIRERYYRGTFVVGRGPVLKEE